MVKESGFAECFTRSEQISTATIKQICEIAFGAIRDVRRSSQAEDKAGFDFAITLGSNQVQTLDLKLRSLDPLQKWGRDDLALETVANTSSGKPGWSVDRAKAVDWILWFWLPTQRWHIASYPLLRQAVEANLDDWRRRFGERVQTTLGLHNERYLSKHIYVPRTLLAQRAFLFQEGNLPGN